MNRVSLFKKKKKKDLFLNRVIQLGQLLVLSVYLLIV